MSIKFRGMAVFLLLFPFLLQGQQLSPKTQRKAENISPSSPREHEWWNLLHYNITITPDYKRKFIEGTNSITFSALQNGKTLLLGLQKPMRITKVSWKNVHLAFKKNEKNAYAITFPKNIRAGERHVLTVFFEGQPQEALNPPFDNGWIWSKDQNERPWMSIACQGSGASIWLPCKEVLYDEPDHGISFSITVPDTLTAVSNGRLQKKWSAKNGMMTYVWVVKNPINNYNIIPYVGKYKTWHQNYTGAKGQLDCDFWVLDYNLDRAKNHFKQVDTMLLAFEHWLGPYPFYKDGYKLVEAPMPGMEHQSAIAYGNGFQNGYNGKNFISGTSWGLKWDFILVHESGHEWFGNSITCSGDGDSWIHEGFTKYLETLYTSYVFGINAGNEYALGTWKRIKNDEPVLGSNTSDKYYKAGAMLHTIRQILGDSLFRGWLRGLNETFYHETVNTSQVLKFLNSYTKRDFSKIFNQYLGTILVPVLEYSFQQDYFWYRWSNCVEGFDMPVKISIGDKNFEVINPTTRWQKIENVESNSDSLSLDKNFFVGSKRKDSIN